jgi:glycosyltransferase involved in cell wall biosynthesis
VVVTLHDVIPLLLPHEYFRNALHRQFYRAQVWLTSRADAVITVSETARRDIVRRTPVPADRMTVIGEGADATLGQPEPIADLAADQDPAPGRAGSAPYLLTMGGAEPRKNVETVIGAFSRVITRIPHRLVVVGGPWRGREAASAVTAALSHAASHDVQDRIDVVGAVSASRLAALYRGAALFMFVSRYEGFGLPVLEAMANGVPVIASNAGALPEIGGAAALYVDPDDIDGLAAAIVQIVSDPQRKATMVSAGRQQSARYSWQDAAKRTVRVYERVAASVTRS